MERPEKRAHEGLPTRLPARAAGSRVRAPGSPLKQHPVICDTHVLTSDLLRRLRSERTALGLLAQFGAVELFAAAHVVEEFERVLPQLASRAGIELEQARSVWYAEYLPFLRVVDLPARRSRRARSVAERDPDDAPTAELALLLAPCHVLSRDHSLVDTGFAHEDWLRVVLAHREVVAVETTAWITSVVGGIVGSLLGALFGWLRRLRPSPEALLILAGLVLLGSLGEAEKSDREGEETDRGLGPRERVAQMGRKSKEALDEAAVAGAELVATAEMRRQASLQVLSVAAVAGESQSVETRLARALARDAEGLQPAELFASAGVGATEASEANEILAEHPAFRFTESRWQFGRLLIDVSPNLGPDSSSG